MSKANIIVAIDGFSSCGKSTLAKQLAQALKFTYIDSGAMYRAMTYHFITNDVNINNLDEVAKSIEHALIEFSNINGENRIYLNDKDVSDEIRKMDVSEKVSKISAIAPVRQAMRTIQQRLGRENNIVMDGRDIGTEVFPYATVKLFMTADPKIRAERRYAELRAKNELVEYDQIFSNLVQRDYDDTTRAESPLVCSPEAIVLDNTNLTTEEQFNLALQIVQESISGQTSSWKQPYSNLEKTSNISPQVYSPENLL